MKLHGGSWYLVHVDQVEHFVVADHHGLLAAVPRRVVRQVAARPGPKRDEVAAVVVDKKLRVACRRNGVDQQ